MPKLGALNIPLQIKDLQNTKIGKNIFLFFFDGKTDSPFCAQVYFFAPKTNRTEEILQAKITHIVIPSLKKLQRLQLSRMPITFLNPEYLPHPKHEEMG